MTVLDRFRLEGRRALVTGGARGLGRTMALALAEVGAEVAVASRTLEDCRAAAEEIARTTGRRCAAFSVDLNRAGEMGPFVREVESGFGAVDILVNNAGIQHVAPVEEFPVDKWNAIIALNLSAAFHTTRLALPAMKKKGWGRIVNIASAHALVASPFKAAYVSAKHGLAGLTKTVALEAAEHGITVNAICPGYVWTPLVEKQIPDTAKARGMTEEQVKREILLAAQPTKRFVAVEEVAELAVFLASDAAASITGALLSIDGGWTAQ